MMSPNAASIFSHVMTQTGHISFFLYIIYHKFGIWHVPNIMHPPKPFFSSTQISII
jgi:hypothetical protein